MKKRRRLTLDRTTIRTLSNPEEAAGGWLTTMWRCEAPTLNYDETCYSCDVTWCNRACSMWACPPPY